jgi:hypothetical protein
VVEMGGIDRVLSCFGSLRRIEQLVIDCWQHAVDGFGSFLNADPGSNDSPMSEASPTYPLSHIVNKNTSVENE